MLLTKTLVTATLFIVLSSCATLVSKARYRTLEEEDKTAAASQQVPQLKIYGINEIPEMWKSKLVAIK